MTRAMARSEINAPKLLTLAFSLGCVAAYFDVLFSPPFAPTLMAFIAIAFGMRRTSPLNALYAAAVTGFLWFLGYGLAWMSKWIFAAAVLGWDVVMPNVFDTIAERSLDSIQIAPELDRLFAASKLALAQQNLAFIKIALGVAAVMAVSAVVLAPRKRDVLVWTLASLLPLAAPFIWIEFMRGHSIIHPQFAARSLALLALIPLLAAYLQLWPQLTRIRRGTMRLPNAATPASFR